MVNSEASQQEERMIILYVICRDEEEAAAISTHLLEQRLVACTNRFPVASAYWWEGKLVDDSEFVLLAKTTARNYLGAREAVLAMHSYSVPCVLRLEVADVAPAYLDWLIQETRPPSSSPAQ